MARVVGYNATDAVGTVVEIKAPYTVDGSGNITAYASPSVTSFPGTGFTAGDGVTFGDVTLATSSGNVIVQVNGQASKTINWKASTITMSA